MAHGLVSMGLRTIATPYLEYAWSCAPNSAGQSITANVITTLTLDTEIQDDANLGTIASNQVTLQPGVYEFEANTCFFDVVGNNSVANLISLYNVTDSSYISSGTSEARGAYRAMSKAWGQLTISTPKVLELRFLAATNCVIKNDGAVSYTLATAGADQRTTLKLWKVA